MKLFMVNLSSPPHEKYVNIFWYWINTHQRFICSMVGHIGKFEFVHIKDNCGCVIDSYKICVFCETKIEKDVGDL